MPDKQTSKAARALAKRRAASMTPEQRTASARKAAYASAIVRSEKARKRKESEHAKAARAMKKARRIAVKRKGSDKN